MGFDALFHRLERSVRCGLLVVVGGGEFDFLELVGGGGGGGLEGVDLGVGGRGVDEGGLVLDHHLRGGSGVCY